MKEEAEKWSKINVPVNDESYIYTTVYSRIRDSEYPFGQVHKACRTKFTFRLTPIEDKYGLIQDPEEVVAESGNDVLISPERRR